MEAFSRMLASRAWIRARAPICVKCVSCVNDFNTGVLERVCYLNSASMCAL